MRREIGRAARDKSAPSIKLLGIYSDRVLPVAVLLVAVFLRLHNLNTIPSGLLYDEAWNGFDALRIIDGERPIFLTGNFGREALFIYLQAISITFFGQTGLALRAVSALIGIMTIIAAYMLVRTPVQRAGRSAYLRLAHHFPLARDLQSNWTALSFAAIIPYDRILLPLAGTRRPRGPRRCGVRAIPILR